MESNLRYCKRCRDYISINDFYIRQEGEYTKFHHKKKLCRKSPVQNLIWDDYLNPKVIKEMKHWYNKNEEKIKAYSRNFNRIQTRMLPDNYVINILKQKGFTDEQINSNPEIIETQKLITKTNRLCKTYKN